MGQVVLGGRFESCGSHAILIDSLDVHAYSMSAMLRGISNILSPH